MAKSYYTLTEAVNIIVENEDAAQLSDLGKRYPLLVSKITRIVAKAGEELKDLMQFMPENLTANKINQSIKRSLEGDEGTEENTEVEDADNASGDGEAVEEKKKSNRGRKKKEAAEEEVDVSDTDYEKWNNAKLYKFLGELGKRKDCKDKYGDMSHDSMLKYLKKYGPGSGNEDMEEDADIEAEDTVEIDYESMKAPELFKLCKERKIKAEVKKPSNYYIALLKKADEEAAKKEEESEDDDWDDEDEPAVEEEAPSKSKGNKSNKAVETPKNKGGRKAAPKEDDDDEDWDI